MDIMLDSDSVFLHHEPCENCGSSDAGARYSDNHFHCFSCGHYIKGDTTDHKRSYKRTGGNHLMSSNGAGSIWNFGESNGRYSALTARGISEETCRKSGYWLAKVNGNMYQVADYRDQNGSIVSQKVRDKEKNFKTTGAHKSDALFLKHLWNGGKKIVVTEGEIDALTVMEIGRAHV